MAENKCAGSGCCERPNNHIDRREFLKTGSLGVAAGALLASGMSGRVMAGPFRGEEFTRLVPTDKKLAPEWVASLTARGEAPVWSGEQLKWIGMPVNGIGGGQLYLGGDGRLWYWGMMNQGDPLSKGPGIRFQDPSRPFSPFEHGSILKIRSGGKDKVMPLDRDGFPDIRFHPSFPTARIEYRAPGTPLEVDLLAFSPYVPTELRRSAYPASLFEYTFRNTGDQPVTIEYANWMENPVFAHTRDKQEVAWSTEKQQAAEFTGLQFHGKATTAQTGADPDAIVFADFEGESYGEGWTTEGNAFGSGPYQGSGVGGQKLEGYQGEGMVNSYSGPGGDKATGRLLSPKFTITKPYINLLVAGGRKPGKVGVRLLVEGKERFNEMGANNNKFGWRSWYVAPLMGLEAQIEIYDQHEGGWGNIDVDQIEFASLPRVGAGDPTHAGDNGSMLMALLGADPEQCQVHDNIRIPSEAAWMQPAGEVLETRAPVSALVHSIKLAPGEEKTVRFALAWRFPYKAQDHITHMYSKLWESPTDTVREIAGNYNNLKKDTLKWVETWYDSTLPHWFMQRSFIPNNCLNANTCELRSAPVEWELMAGEGVDCCGGNCTHVWHYAQGAARIFPEIERLAREHVELGRGYVEGKGIIKFRAVPSTRFMTAVDGTSGTILRVLREHQMTEDNRFLTRVWPRTKKAMQHLIDEYDPDQDGMTTGWQHNTLDADWAGKVPWLIGMYLAALRASAEMADILGDAEFKKRCESIVERGSKNLVDQTWNENYGYFEMIRNPDLEKESNGTYEGCHIDQVLGDAWLRQVNLPNVLPMDKIHKTLDSLYRFNFTPDVGPYREKYQGGRWYAMAGDAGLLMCSFPFGGDEVVATVGGGHMGYLNECMSGFEWQVAAHMIWEGRIQEGLAVGKAIGDRYAPERRNPFNEIECGDHYARAMAAHGAFLAACGYRYDGPRGFLAFAPRLTPEDFRAPFNVARGWGTFTQKCDGYGMSATLDLKHGSMRLKTLQLALPEGKTARSGQVALVGAQLPASVDAKDGQAVVTLKEPVEVTAGQVLHVGLMLA